MSGVCAACGCACRIPKATPPTIGACRLCRETTFVRFLELSRWIPTTPTGNDGAVQTAWVCLGCAPPEVAVAQVPDNFKRVSAGTRAAVPPPQCIDCGALVSKARILRCVPCYRALPVPPRRVPTLCVDCGRTIDPRSQRCHACYRALRPPRRHSCLDCGTAIPHDHQRCLACYQASRRATTRQPVCLDCGQPISRNATRCLRDSIRSRDTYEQRHSA